MNKRKINRDLNMDVLRILSSFFVILIHVSGHYYMTTKPDTYNFRIYNFYNSISRSAVSIFIMISGTFLLSKMKNIKIKDLYKNYILKLTYIYIIWSCIYSIINTNNFKNFIIEAIKSPFHLWFLPTIIGIYIISPFIYKIIEKKDKKLLKYFIYLFTLSSLLKTITYLPINNYINIIINKLPINILCNYYSYFILGYYIYNNNINYKYRKTIYTLGILSPIIAMISTYLISINSSSNFLNLYKDFSIFTFFEATALFTFFKYHKFNNINKYEDKIIILSNNTLGIYLVHILVLNILFKYYNITNFNTLISVPISTIIIFIISLLITNILKKIKYINKII